MYSLFKDLRSIGTRIWHETSFALRIANCRRHDTQCSWHGDLTLGDLCTPDVLYNVLNAQPFIFGLSAHLIQNSDVCFFGLSAYLTEHTTGQHGRHDNQAVRARTSRWKHNWVTSACYDNPLLYTTYARTAGCVRARSWFSFKMVPELGWRKHHKARSCRA